MSNFLPIDKKLFFAFVSACLLVLSFAPFNIWVLSWIAFIPLFFIIKHSTAYEAFFVSLLSGILFWLGSVYWLTHVSIFGCLFIVCYLALGWGIFGLAARYVFKQHYDKHPLVVLVLLPLIWVAIECLRAEIPVFGLGWLLLGFSQTSNLPFLQAADLFGAYGLSCLVMIINLSLFLLGCFFADKKKKLFLECLAGLLILGALIYSYGYIRMKESPEGIPIRIGIIQGNIPQNQKWDPALRDSIIEKYATLTTFESYDGPELMILPEACFPKDILRQFDGTQLKNAIVESQTPVLIGAIKLISYYEEYNSALLFNKNGELQQSYDKIKLVPFGEYVPWKPLFSMFGLEKLAYSLGVGDFKKGTELTVFSPVLGSSTKRVLFSTLICFEDIFPGLSRSFLNRGAQFLVVITNDAWYKKTTAAYQHLQASILRAVENKCYVVRAANTGISAFISPHGNVLDYVHDQSGESLFVTGGITRAIIAGCEKTIYRRFGFLFPYISLLFSTGYLIYALFFRANWLKIKKLQ